MLGLNYPASLFPSWAFFFDESHKTPIQPNESGQQAWIYEGIAAIWDGYAMVTDSGKAINQVVALTSLALTSNGWKISVISSIQWGTDDPTPPFCSEVRPEIMKPIDAPCSPSFRIHTGTSFRSGFLPSAGNTRSRPLAEREVATMEGSIERLG
ncbi:putative SnoaL-like domain-containing protein [Seiridium cardinale]